MQDATDTSIGVSRDIGASDIVISLGGCQVPGGADCNLSAREQAGTLMHELGHNLGLRHGGGDDTNYKPTYISIMNYAFQFSWLRRTTSTPSRSTAAGAPRSTRSTPPRSTSTATARSPRSSRRTSTAMASSPR
jgi:hypothetical protein